MQWIKTGAVLLCSEWKLRLCMYCRPIARLGNPESDIASGQLFWIILNNSTKISSLNFDRANEEVAR
jgi:hypothetical protein